MQLKPVVARPVPKNYMNIIDKFPSRTLKRCLQNNLSQLKELPQFSDMPIQLYQQPDIIENNECMNAYAKLMASLYGVTVERAQQEIVITFPQCQQYFEQSEMYYSSNYESDSSEYSDHEVYEKKEASKPQAVEKKEKTQQKEETKKQPQQKQKLKPKCVDQVQQDITLKPKIEKVQEIQTTFTPQLTVWRSRIENYKYNNNLKPELHKEIVFNVIKNLENLFIIPKITQFSHEPVQNSESFALKYYNVLPIYHHDLQKETDYKNFNKNTIDLDLIINQSKYNNQQKINDIYLQEKQVNLNIFNDKLTTNQSIQQNQLIFILSGVYVDTNTFISNIISCCQNLIEQKIMYKQIKEDMKQLEVISLIIQYLDNVIYFNTEDQQMCEEKNKIENQQTVLNVQELVVQKIKPENDDQKLVSNNNEIQAIQEELEPIKDIVAQQNDINQIDIKNTDTNEQQETQIIMLKEENQDQTIENQHMEEEQIIQNQIPKQQANQYDKNVKNTILIDLNGKQILNNVSNYILLTDDKNQVNCKLVLTKQLGQITVSLVATQKIEVDSQLYINKQQYQIYNDNFDKLQINQQQSIFDILQGIIKQTFKQKTIKSDLDLFEIQNQQQNQYFLYYDNFNQYRLVNSVYSSQIKQIFDLTVKQLELLENCPSFRQIDTSKLLSELYCDFVYDGRYFIYAQNYYLRELEQITQNAPLLSSEENKQQSELLSTEDMQLQNVSVDEFAKIELLNSNLPSISQSINQTPLMNSTRIRQKNDQNKNTQLIIDEFLIVQLAFYDLLNQPNDILKLKILETKKQYRICDLLGWW